MSDLGEGILPADEFRFVNDPDTGAHDAILEIWLLGEHDQTVADGVQKITELNNGVFGPFPLRDGLALTRQAVTLMLQIAPALLPKAPKGINFIAVGEEQSCAISVSYKQPHETPPATHPGIDIAVGELIGQRYITITQKALGKA